MVYSTGNNYVHVGLSITAKFFAKVFGGLEIGNSTFSMLSVQFICSSIFVHAQRSSETYIQQVSLHVTFPSAENEGPLETQYGKK